LLLKCRKEDSMNSSRRAITILSTLAGMITFGLPMLAQAPNATSTSTSYTIRVNAFWGAANPVSIRIDPGETGAASGGGPKDIPAKACVVGSNENCFIAKDKDYDYGDAEAETMEIGGGKSALLFLARFSGVSDSLTLIVLLGLNNQGKLANLLPATGYTLQDAYKFWSNPGISEYELLTVANYNWDMKNETHFSQHRYRIKTFAFCPGLGHYVLADKFATRRKFIGLDGEDNPGEIVIKAEMAAAKSRLLQKHSSHDLCSIKPQTAGQN
jgi:hypothetical protein